MKVLVINGSPKGKASNSYKLTKAFLEGLRLGIAPEGEAFELEELLVTLNGFCGRMSRYGASRFIILRYRERYRT